MTRRSLPGDVIHGPARGATKSRLESQKETPGSSTTPRGRDGSRERENLAKRPGHCVFFSLLTGRVLGRVGSIWGTW